MQDIDKFGFNLVNLAKKENYPWSSPEAAIESVMDMTPEEFLFTTRALVLDYEEGTEGVWQSIKDFGTWIVNIFRRFWNWITGNNKKEEKKIDEIQDKIKTLDKEQKVKGNINPEAIRKGMDDDSTVLEFGDDGPKYVHKYWSVNPGKLTTIAMRAKGINDFVADMLKGIEGVKTWVEFAANVDVKDTLSKVNEYKGIIKQIADTAKDLKVTDVDSLIEAAALNKTNYKSLTLFKEYNKQIETNLEKLKKHLDDISPRINTYSDKQVDLQKAITLYITDIYPTYKNAVKVVLNKMDTLYKTCIDRNRRSAKVLQGKGESEDFDIFDEIDFDSGNETFDYIIEPFDLFEMSPGTEGFIGDAWEWFKNLISKFWNWITGNNKKEEKKIEKVEEKIQTLNKAYKENNNSNTTSRTSSNKSTIHQLGFKENIESPSKYVYWAPVSIDSLSNKPDNLDSYIIDIGLVTSYINGLTSAIKKSESWDDLMKRSKSGEISKLRDHLRKGTKRMNELTSRLQLKAYDDISDARRVNLYYYDKIKTIKRGSLTIAKAIEDLSNAVKNIKLNPNTTSSLSERMNGTLVQCLTNIYPGYKRSVDDFITKLDALYDVSIKRNKSSTKANKKSGNESEEYDILVELDDFEPFVYEGIESYSDYRYIGTEGVWQSIKDFGKWIKDLISRFWNWLTGADKKVEKEVKESVESLDKLEKDLKNRKNNKDKKSRKPNTPRNNTNGKPNSTKNTNTSSNTQSQTTNTSQSSKEETSDSYDVPNLNYLNELNKLMYDARSSLSSIRKFLKRSKNWDAFIQKGTIDAEFNLPDNVMLDLNDIQIALKSSRSKFSSKDIQSCPYDEALEKIKYQRDLIKKLYRMLKLDIVDATEEIKKTLESYPGVTEDTKGTDAFKRVMILLTTAIPSLVKQFRLSLKAIRQLVKTCSTKLNGAGESEDFDYNDFLNTEGSTSLETLYGFALPKSVTSAYIYDGLEEEYDSIKKILSECDAKANEYFDDYVFFGTEGFVDTVKLYSHKIWDAIRRFFMWIASKFSDKYKEKYEIEKLRAKLNSAVKDYANYIRYDDHHHKKTSGNESLIYELDLFGITSGLESAPSSITVTDYDAMNKSIEEIGENSKDLARFTKYFIDMVSTGRANAKDFKKFITPNLISLPSKLNQVKFPGTKTITPDDIQSFRDEVNTSLDYCKEFKSIIDYMNKHKAKIDRFFENPELKDNSLAKDMIAAMNRYFVPSVKTISNILDWYVRCINTDIRKLNDATK